MKITPDDILSEIAKALKDVGGQFPDPKEGWKSMTELRVEMDLGEPTIRRRLRVLGERVERRRFANLMYYRIKS